MIRKFSGTQKFKRVLVTGAAGFVGRHLVRELQTHGHEVAATDQIPITDLSNYRRSDLGDRETLFAVVDDVQPDACVHLGALSFVPDGDKHPEQLLAVNIAGTVNLADAIRIKAPHCRLLFVSSSQVYGPVTSLRAANIPIRENAPLLPLSLYAISKTAAENAVLAYASAYDLDVQIARPANHTGPGQSEKFVAVSFARQLITVKQHRGEKAIHVGNLDSIRDFTDVRDVVAAYRLIIERGKSGQAYNITTNARVRIGELLEKLQHIVGVSPETIVDPKRYRPSDASLKLDITRIREQTGWAPAFTLDETLADIVNDIESSTHPKNGTSHS